MESNEGTHMGKKDTPKSENQQDRPDIRKGRSKIGKNKKNRVRV